ncbi:MAG TPA: molybdopterin converting factor subunit 1 [Vicinamibacteria bacterium]|nr:molybdopterin converting factor subunit 1 [Vicinamibacteria bacterium]
MRVRVRLFASLREAVGRSEVELELPEGATADEAWRVLAREYAGLAERRARLTAAVNRRYATFDAILADGDEVVFVPPVSGGSTPAA